MFSQHKVPDAPAVKPETVSCRGCGFSNPVNFRFCGQCGQRLGEAEAERRQLTVMFFDLVGSTTLSAELDPEELRELVRAYQTRCNAVVRRYGGYVAQFLGDGILVYFGYPEAHSDDGWRAVSCALSILQAMRELNVELADGGRPRLDLRVGMHTGLVVVGELGSAEHRENLAIGETPNVAARLQGLAGINEVVLSAATLELVGEAFQIDELGEHSLKGVPEPMAVYRAVDWAAPRSAEEGAPAGPLFGRDDPLAQLQQAWTAALHGRGGLLEVLGESGLGKSRLLRELTAQTLDGDPLVLTCYPEPQFADSPWWAARAVLEQVLETSDPRLSRQERLLALLSDHAPTLDPVTAYPPLRRLLGIASSPAFPDPVLSPAAWRKLTADTLCSLGMALADRRPWLIRIDGSDILDPSSLEWLQQMSHELRSCRALVVLAGSRSVVPGELRRIRLERLGPAEALSFVRHLWPDIPAATAEQIVQRGDGTPLFLEQLVLVAQRRPGATLPGRLRDFFTARLDSLGPAKRHAQLGSVVGRRFSRRLLACLLEGEVGHLQGGVRELLEQQVVEASASRDELWFRHALMHEVCYESLLRSVRQGCHARLADALEQQYATWCEENPTVLAYHLEHSAQPERAVPWLARALSRCLSLSALNEATRLCAQGLELLDRLAADHPLQEYRLRFLTLGGTAWIGLRGYAAPEVARCYESARELCAQLGDSLAVFPVLAGLWALYLVQGRLQDAAALAARLMDLSGQGDSLHRRLASAAGGQTLFFQGQFRLARAQLEEAVSLYSPGRADGQAIAYLLTEPSIASASYLSWCDLLLGYEEQALERAEQALLWARELNHPHTLAHTLFFEAWLRLNLDDFSTTRALLRELDELALRQAFGLWQVMGTALQGWLDLRCGEPSGFLALQAGLGGAEVIGTRLGSTWWLANSSLLLRAGGDDDGADAMLQAAAQAAESVGERWVWPILLHLRGKTQQAQAWAERQGSALFLERYTRLSNSFK